MPVPPISTWGILHWILACIILAGCVAIAYAVINYLGIVIPSIVVYIFWVCVVVAIACAAIKFLWGLFFGGPPGPSV